MSAGEESSFDFCFFLPPLFLFVCSMRIF
jgi:hypothetical protein